MTAWAHRYSEPLLWLACAAVVVALSCVPRCARAEEIAQGVSVDGAYIYWNANYDGKIRRASLDKVLTGRVWTDSRMVTDGVVEIGSSAPANHVHAIPIVSGGGGWTAPRLWTEGEIVGTCIGSTGTFLALVSLLSTVRKRRYLASPLRRWRCRICGETASGTDVADACVAHILAGACNGDMEDEPLPVEAIGGVSAKEAAQNLRRLQS